MAFLKSEYPVRGDVANIAQVPGLAGVTLTPRLNPFDEMRDNLSNYSMTFERIGTSWKIRKEEWTIPLATLLQGKSLDVYSRLNDDDVTQKIMRK